MDVRCERCKTEYEFDESRVTEAGVAVQCTTCGHVFKVKKKVVLITLPLDPGDMEAGPSMDSNGAREWHVRQANGNQLRFRELTTLQRWIVERKVARDDEISLNGQRWKRLGSIAELASFFQVVEETQRAGRRMDGTPSVVIDPEPQPSAVATSPAVYPPLATSSSAGSRSIGFRESNPSSRTAKVIVEEFPFLGDFPESQGSTLGIPVRDRPAFERSDPTPEVEIEEAQGKADHLPASKRGGVGRWLVIISVLAGLGALAYFGYVNIWLGQQQKEASAARANAELEQQARAREESAAQERQRLISEARARAAAETLAGEEQARAAAEAEHLRAVPDAKPAKAPKEKPRNFDWYMSEANQLREKRKTQAALDAYSQAAELRPDRAEPFAGRGLTLLEMSDSDQAEASFQVALKLNPRYGAAVIGLARTYLAQGKKEKAIESYNKYLEILPDGPEAAATRQKLRQLKEE